jgi:Ca2+-binding EF-hand superfamily protein
MFKALGAGAAAAFLFSACPAAAQAPGGDISRAQAETMVRGMFDQVDASKDGVVDQTELKAFIDMAKGQGAPDPVLAKIQKIFGEAAGPDGKVTLAAFTKTRMDAFDKGDTNHDGKLDAAEQAALQSAGVAK